MVDTTLCAGPSQPSIGLLYDETPIFLPESHTAFEKLKVPIQGCWMIFAPTELIRGRTLPHRVFLDRCGDRSPRPPVVEHHRFAVGRRGVTADARHAAFTRAGASRF